MKLSRRISAVKTSPTVALNASAKALKNKGVHVLNFAVGEPDFPTPRSIVDRAIQALDEGMTKYGPAGGSPRLREAIAAKLQRENDLVFQPDEIVVGVGAKEVLFHTFLATLNEGDEVLVPAPFWVSYPDQIVAAGGKPVLVPVPEDIKKSPLSVHDLEHYASDRTVGIVLNSPNNPAGYVLGEDCLRELGTLLMKNDWWVISDEIYEYLSFDKPMVSILKLFPELKDRTFVVNGLSKGFAMTGWRVGYVAGPPEAVKLVKSLQSHSSTCIPPFIEEAAIFAVENGRSLMEKEIDILRSRRDLAVSLLDRMDNVSYVPPEGAFYIFIDVREALARSDSFKSGDTMSFCERLLLEDHTAMVPGEAFGAPGFIRFSYAADENSIKEGMARLEVAVNKICR